MRHIFLGCSSGGAGLGWVGLDGTGLELEGFGFRPALTVLAMAGKSASKKVGASEGCQGRPIQTRRDSKEEEKKRREEKKREEKRRKEKKREEKRREGTKSRQERKRKKKRRREEIIYLQE